MRWAGAALAAGGLLWQPLLAFQNLAGLHVRSTTWQWYLDQWGFLVAMTCLLVGLVALDRARVTGEGRIGRGAMHVLVLAWGAMVLGQLVKLTLGWDLGVVGIIGGLLTYPSALVAGFAPPFRADRASCPHAPPSIRATAIVPMNPSPTKPRFIAHVLRTGRDRPTIPRGNQPKG